MRRANVLLCRHSSAPFSPIQQRQCPAIRKVLMRVSGKADWTEVWCPKFLFFRLITGCIESPEPPTTTTTTNSVATSTLTSSTSTVTTGVSAVSTQSSTSISAISFDTRSYDMGTSASTRTTLLSSRQDSSNPTMSPVSYPTVCTEVSQLKKINSISFWNFWRKNTTTKFRLWLFPIDQLIRFR